MTRRTALRAIASSFVLATLVVFPPTFMVAAVGNPLPTEMPAWAQAWRTIRFLDIDPWIFAKALALFIWVNWAYVVAAIAMEFAAQLTDHARTLTVPGIQQALGRLVGTVTFAITTLTHSSSPALAMAGPSVEQTEPAPDPNPVFEDGRVAADETVLEYAGPTTEVGWLDTYMEIAERTLGDPMRWNEIRDLNIGRTMPNGHEITPADEAIEEGWTLWLPNGADTSTSPPQPPAEITVQPGDNLWDIAERHVASALGGSAAPDQIVDCWNQIIEINRDRLVDPDKPDLIHPGQTFVLPPVGAQPQVKPEPVRPPQTQPVESPAPASEPSTDVEPGNASAPHSAEHDATSGESNDGTSPIPVAVIGAVSTALAVGVTRAIQLRRKQRFHRTPDKPPASPQRPKAHRELLTQADEGAYGRLRRALDELAAGIASNGYPCRPRVVQVLDGRIEVLLDRPATPAIEGWQAEASGQIWTTASDPAGRDHADETDVDGRPPPTPLLVTLGQPDTTGGQLYIDLETAGVISLTGDPLVAAGVARSMVSELAYSPMADPSRLMVVGDLGGRFDGLDPVTTCDNWDALPSGPEAWAEQTHGVIATNRWPNGFVARGQRIWHDALTPLAVISAITPDAKVTETILASRPSSAALVVVGDPVEGSLVINCAADKLELPQFGLACRPHLLDPVAIEAITQLLDNAVATTDDPVAAAVLTGRDSQDFDDLYEDPPYDVLVRFLGNMTIEGTPDRLPPRHRAVVAYVALHPGATAERIEDSIWEGMTDRRSTIKRFNEIRKLGGSNIISTADNNGGYHPGSKMVTDLHLFEKRTQAAATMSRKRAIDTLEGALELVTGKIFTYRDAESRWYRWISDEDLIAHWEYQIAAVARNLAQLRLDHNEPDKAAELAHRMLASFPTDTGLTETLMAAHAAMGNHRVARCVYDSHVAALRNIDHEPADSIVELYEQMRRRSAQ